MEVGSCSSARDSEQLTDLRMRETFDVVHHDHRSRPLRQFRESFGKPFLQLRVFSGVSEGRLQSVGQLLRASHFAPPGYVQRGIRDNAVEPWTETLRRVESPNRLVRSNESFLDRVLRVLVNRYDRPGDEIRALLVQTHQTREGVVIACAGRCGQRAFLVWSTHWPPIMLG